MFCSQRIPTNFKVVWGLFPETSGLWGLISHGKCQKCIDTWTIYLYNIIQEVRLLLVTSNDNTTI